MKTRYTADELARMSDDELVRRQFDLRNLSWLAALLVFFILLRPLLLLVTAGDADLPELPEKQIMLATLAQSVLLIERLVRVIESHEPHASAATIRDTILRDVERFRGGAPQDDDITIVVAKLI